MENISVKKAVFMLGGVVLLGFAALIGAFIGLGWVLAHYLPLSWFEGAALIALLLLSAVYLLSKWDYSILRVLLFVLLGSVWSIGIGWLLRLIAPFTLFESVLLVQAASFVLANIFSFILDAASEKLGEESDEAGSFDDWEDPDYVIPLSRFAKTESGLTNEAWFRYEISNHIYQSVENVSAAKGLLSSQQIQELAIRLSDVVTNMMKRKRPYNKQYTLSIAALKKEFVSMNQQPYDDLLLNLTVRCVNSLLGADEELLGIVRYQVWDEPY